MHRTHTLSPAAARVRLLALALLVLMLNGCASMKSAWLSPGHPEAEVERHHFPTEKGNDVIGRLATLRLEERDTLPDIARHFGLGINALSAANPGLDVWVPEAGKQLILPLCFILPDVPRKGIVINLATMRLFQFKGDGAVQAVSTYPVGIGTRERPTPTGSMHVARKAARPTWHVPASIAEDHRRKGDPLPAKILPGPLNPLGDYALYLSKTGYLIHGTNKPASIGLKASNGCLRLYPENVKVLFNNTPTETPVQIVNQPYLLGQRDGMLYLEAHTPLENPSSGALEQEKVDARLRTLEKKAGRPLDWKKVKQVQAEARGIPVPILALAPGLELASVPPLEVGHPDKLYGSPEQPELRPGAWHVLAGETREEIDARRLAAIINHQGPQIPARVLPKSNGYRVLAGPFNDAGEAREAARRLKVDLEIDGIVIEPARETVARH